MIVACQKYFFQNTRSAWKWSRHWIFMGGEKKKKAYLGQWLSPFSKIFALRIQTLISAFALLLKTVWIKSGTHIRLTPHFLSSYSPMCSTMNKFKNSQTFQGPKYSLKCEADTGEWGASFTKKKKNKKNCTTNEDYSLGHCEHDSHTASSFSKWCFIGVWAYSRWVCLLIHVQ